MNMPINVQSDKPSEDTEWNDILRQHGVIPEKPPSPTAEIQEALLEAKRLAHENRLEGKDLDELDELEDDEDEEFLESYRRKRMAEMSILGAKAKFGSVFPLQKPDYAREVTEASKSCFVVVLMSSSLASNHESTILQRDLWPEAARKFAEVKFCDIRADMAAENYPERNCPTILVYKDTEIKQQVVTLKEWGGVAGASLKNIEQLLVTVKAVKFDDIRLQRKTDEEDEELHKSIKSGGGRRKAGDDSDDDWD